MLRAKRTCGKTTTLQIEEGSRDVWSSFEKSFASANKSEGTSLNGGCTINGGFRENFIYLTRDYFESIGFGEPQEIYAFKGCESCAVFPFEEVMSQGDFKLSGYRPELKINFDFKDGIARAFANLSREGYPGIVVLEDIIESYKKSTKSEIEFHGGKVDIAPERVFDYMGDVKKVYNRLGKNNFEELFDIYKTFHNLRGESVSRKILLGEYNKRVRIFMNDLD